MNPLEPPDSFHVLAAHGWLELGCPAEAVAELERIAPPLLSHPDVLKARWDVFSRLGRWDLCAEVGAGLVEAEPEDTFGWINRAYALRRAPGGGVQAASEALRPAADRLQDLEWVTFNLACYTCQLGRLDEARDWLAKSLAVARRAGHLPRARANALAEPDLEPLWNEIKGS